MSLSGGHIPPFTNWATAATNIQAAINKAAVGSLVWVTNGVYETGGKAVWGDLINRVALDKPITVQSVNGPTVTVIRGSEAPGGGNGYGAVRCAYLTNGAVLAGFTLTHGYTYESGLSFGVGGGGVWCESTSSVLSHCVLTDNHAIFGGGAQGGTLLNCILTNNTAYDGGGAYRVVLYNCFLVGNSAYNDSGGAYGGSLYNCTLTGNIAHGSYGGGGGACDATMYNCIVYYNTASEGPNWRGGSFDHCCTAPMPPGNGNITNEPGIVTLSNPRLLPSSVCINAGTNQAWMTSAVDMDEEDRLQGIADIGADEYYSGGLTGSLVVGITAEWLRVAVGYPVNFMADIQGRAQGNEWDWRDGSFNQDVFVVQHSFATAGVYAVTLAASNWSGSASTTGMVVVVGDLYVSPSGNHTAPFDTWEKAATNIQAAIDEAGIDCLVWVTNGVYETGGKAVQGALTNRVALDKPMTVRSVNGPSVTVIRGLEAMDGGKHTLCVYDSWSGSDGLHTDQWTHSRSMAIGIRNDLAAEYGANRHPPC